MSVCVTFQSFVLAAVGHYIVHVTASNQLGSTASHVTLVSSSCVHLRCVFSFLAHALKLH